MFFIVGQHILGDEALHLVHQRPKFFSFRRLRGQTGVDRLTMDAIELHFLVARRLAKAALERFHQFEVDVSEMVLPGFLLLVLVKSPKQRSKQLLFGSTFTEFVIVFQAFYNKVK